MRVVKRSITNFLCCRMKKYTKYFIIGLVLFIIGNYFLLRLLSTKHDEVVRVEDNEYKREELKNFFEVERHKGEVDNTIYTEDPFREIILTQKAISVEDKDITIKKDTTIHNEQKIEINEHKENTKKIALLVMACNRIEIQRCLDKIFQYLPKQNPLPVIVSQDCGHERTAQVIRSYGSKLELIQQPDLGPVDGVPQNMHRYMGYYKISRHFKWALTEVFKKKDIDSVIIVEDDIDISPDFFDYFLATRKLLDQDESIFCISAWNDNGKEDSVDPSAIDVLYRSDFFPGLGWMMTRKIWNEIGGRWPKGFWDDWMRAPAQRKDRVCIRPEISRTKTFGRIGVSQGQFYDQYLQFIKLNSKPFPFLDYDLSYLLKSNYDDKFLETVYAAPEVQVSQIKSNSEDTVVRITYNSNGQFENLSRRFGLMTDFKAGVPRTAYKGIVTFYRNNKRIYIAPPKSWTGYSEH